MSTHASHSSLPPWRVLAATLADAVDAWDQELSSYCDGPERDRVRALVVQVRRKAEQSDDLDKARADESPFDMPILEPRPQA